MARSELVTGVRLLPGADAHATTTAGEARLPGAGKPVFPLTCLSVDCVSEETNAILPPPPVLEAPAPPAPRDPVLMGVCRRSLAPPSSLSLITIKQ